MLRPGDEPIPGYRLEQFLGRGQFGEVWRSTAPGGGRAALKFLDLGGKQGWKEFRGIQSVKKIRHPHLMPITALWLLDEDWRIIDEGAVDRLSAPTPSTRAIAQTLMVGETETDDPEPRWLVVAQLLGDKTLGDRLQECERDGQPGIPVEELLRYMEEAAKGIDFLNSAKHDLGHGRAAVQHCDIKPANILLLGDSVLICDYGVAQVLADGGTAATATGMIGSPAYMAPECVERRPSHASDQYSLAVTYVELRTGGLPFRNESYFEVIEAHRKGKLDLSRLPANEQRVIRTATSVDPKDRFPTSQDMVRELARVVHGEGAAGGSRWRAAWPLVATLSLIVLAALFTMWRFLPQPVKLQLVLQVEPTDARVEVDGKSMSLDGQGRLTVDGDAKRAWRVRVSKAPEYEAVEQFVQPAQAAAGPLKIALALQPTFLVERAWQCLARQQFDAAVDDYAAALARQPDLNRWPAPEVLLPPQTDRAIECLAMTPDGQWMLAAASNGEILRWPATGDGKSATAQRLAPPGPAVRAIAVSNSQVAAADLEGQVVVRDILGNGKERGRLQLVKNEIAVALTPDGRWLVTGSDGGEGEYRVHAWQIEDGTVANKPRELGVHEKVVDQIRSTPDSSAVVSGGWDGVSMWWSLTSSGENRPLAPLDGAIYDLAVTGQAVMVGGERTLVAAEFPESETRRHRLVVVPKSDWTARVLPEGHDDVIEVVAANANGEWIASGSDDGTIQVWRFLSADDIKGPIVLTGHEAVINAVQFDAAGDWLVSTDVDGKVAFWDLRTTDARGPYFLGHHPGGAAWVAIDPGARWIVSAGADGAVRRWDLPRCRTVLRACQKTHVVPQMAP